MKTEQQRITPKHSKQTKVQVRKLFKEPGTVYASTEYKRHDGQKRVFEINNPPPGLSCAKLKRLVEIAGMDEDELIQLIETALHNGNGRIGSDIAKALGLGSQSRKG